MGDVDAGEVVLDSVAQNAPGTRAREAFGEAWASESCDGEDLGGVVDTLAKDFHRHTIRQPADLRRCRGARSCTSATSRGSKRVHVV